MDKSVRNFRTFTVFSNIFIWISLPICSYQSKLSFCRENTPAENIFASPGPEVTYFMLNSAEHEIFSAYKYENANNSYVYKEKNCGCE